MKQSKVLFINLPGSSIRKPEEHCGLAFLKAFLTKAGTDAEILDAYALGMSIEQCLSAVSNWIENNKHHTKYIGISPYVTSHDEFCSVLNFVKSKDSSTVTFAGGHYATLNKEHLLVSIDSLDAIVVGEGEFSTLELVENGINESNIPGIYQRKYAAEFKKRERIPNLDILPFQDRYLSLDNTDEQPFAITTSRGCYGECTFCSISSFYKCNTPTKEKQTYRSASSVSAELHLLKEKHGAKYIKIVDDNFFRKNSDQFLEELADKVEHLNLSIRLSARPNDITPSRAKLLKKLGASIVAIGVESADENALKLFNKGIDVSQSEKTIDILKNEGIGCLANFITFNPTIDIEGLKKNADFISAHINDCIFHRINSHLWVRATDPIVEVLKELNLSDGSGFPYVNCNYKHPEILDIKTLFDQWCNSNNKKYYRFADILMANGTLDNEDIYTEYKKMLAKDVSILKDLIYFYDNGKLDTEGKRYIANQIREKK